MLKVFLKTTIIKLLKDKLFSLINILGLAVGLAASIILFLYVQNEWSYDKHWLGSSNIYKLMHTESGASEIDLRVSAKSAPNIHDYFGNVITNTAVLEKAYFSEVTVGTNTFVEDVDFVNADFTEVFQFDTIAGDINSIFQNPNTLALSAASALQWFGETDVVGETVSIKEFFTEQAKDYDIVAVYQQLEGNSTIDVKVMGWLPELVAGPRGGHEVYLKLDSQMDPEFMRDKFPDFVNQYADLTEYQLADGQAVSDISRYHLINIGDLYFNPIYCAAWNARPCGSLPVVAGFAAIAVLVLLTACVNYIVLTLSKAGQRAREVAMRKVSGASSRQLFVLFFGESLLILILSLVLALTLVDIFLPLFENIAGVQMPFNFSNPESFFLLVGLLLSVSLFAGFYPSLYISRFNPALILKSHQSSGLKGFNRLHGILLVFQFSTSIGLLIATLIVFGQLLYMQRLDPGFNPDNLVQIAVGRPEINARADVLRQEVLNSTQVYSAALTGMDPGENGVVISDEYKANSLPLQKPQRIPTIPVGFDFFETVEMPRIAGRFFEVGRDRPESLSPFGQSVEDQDQLLEASVILNEAAVKVLGYSSIEEALNQTISSGMLDPSGSGEKQSKIIGIVSDSQYRSLQREAGPEVFFLSPDMAFFLMVRFNGDGQTVISELETIWRNVMGDEVFESSLVADNLTAVFKEEKNQGVVLITFALLSIFISCLGLYGVTAFIIDRRTKEIGIRKVFGSDVRQVVWLFCWQFSKPIMIANVIAWPVTLWAMLNWLQRFPYQIDTLLLIPLCVLAGFIALSIAWLTVAANTVKVANTLPAYALRYE